MATTKEQELLTVIEIDVATGELIERPLSDKELTQRKTDLATQKTAELEAKAKTDARQSAMAKLEKLGLTVEEIAAL
jgi:hypothetical protein